MPPLYQGVNFYQRLRGRNLGESRANLPRPIISNRLGGGDCHRSCYLFALSLF